ncbi:hypothetical protein PR048_015588 [Dryococelus australis]|uniref:Uncharacterized protein n=1 Tax=Dryococelus australis TaxID=614101 RepID=A0ABQ9HHM7_9NEOP|nr:hypothetical protein PR048_015588 [Dryococelus australis]
MYGVGETTIWDIQNNKSKLIEFASSANSTSGLANRKTKLLTYAELDKAILEWFNQKRAAGMPVLGLAEELPPNPQANRASSRWASACSIDCRVYAQPASHMCLKHTYSLACSYPCIGHTAQREAIFNHVTSSTILPLEVLSTNVHVTLHVTCSQDCKQVSVEQGQGQRSSTFSHDYGYGVSTASSSPQCAAHDQVSEVTSQLLALSHFSETGHREHTLIPPLYIVSLSLPHNLCFLLCAPLRVDDDGTATINDELEQLCRTPLSLLGQHTAVVQNIPSPCASTGSYAEQTYPLCSNRTPLALLVKHTVVETIPSPCASTGSCGTEHPYPLWSTWQLCRTPLILVVQQAVVLQNIPSPCPAGNCGQSKVCLPYLKKSNAAHILNISPPLNMEPVWFKNHVAYTMAKYGMSMCVLGMAEEFRDDKIAVNALWPRTGEIFIHAIAPQTMMPGVGPVCHCSIHWLLPLSWSVLHSQTTITSTKAESALITKQLWAIQPSSCVRENLASGILDCTQSSGKRLVIVVADTLGATVALIFATVTTRSAMAARLMRRSRRESVCCCHLEPDPLQRGGSRLSLGPRSLRPAGHCCCYRAGSLRNNGPVLGEHTDSCDSRQCRRCGSQKLIRGTVTLKCEQPGAVEQSVCRACPLALYASLRETLTTDGSFGIRNAVREQTGVARAMHRAIPWRIVVPASRSCIISVGYTVQVLAVWKILLSIKLLWGAAGSFALMSDRYGVGITESHCFLTAIHTAAIEMLSGSESANSSRKPDIMADAAYAILIREPSNYTGHFAIDEEVLKEEGIVDLVQYAVNPEENMNVN